MRKHLLYGSTMIVASAALFASAASAQQLPIEREIPVSAGETLEFDLDTGGSISITGGAGSSVRVVVTGDDDDPCRPDCEIRIERVGSGVLVQSEHNGDGNRQSSDLHFEVQVPERFDLRISTMGGDLSIENVTGDIDGRVRGARLHRRPRGRLQDHQ